MSTNCALLVELYLKYRIPVDSFDGFPAEKAAFVQEWRTLSNCSDTAQDLVHYMRVQRKTARWVQLGDNHRSLPPLPELTAEQTEVLVGIYYDNVTVLENGSDVLSYDEDISELIAKEFHEETDLYIEPYVLVTKLTALRRSAVSCQKSLIFPRPKRVAASTTSTKRSSECSPTF